MAAQLEAEGRGAESLVHYRKILSLDPANAAAPQGVPRLEAAGIRLPPGAIRSLLAEDLRREDEALAWIQEGNSLALSGHCELAITYFLQAVKLDPNFADAQSNLGSCYGRLGRYRDALAALEAAVAIDPGHKQAIQSLGQARRALGIRHRP